MKLRNALYIDIDERLTYQKLQGEEKLEEPSEHEKGIDGMKNSHFFLKPEQKWRHSVCV